MPQLFDDIFNDIITFCRLQLFLHSPQGDTHNVTMVEPGPPVALAQLQPHLMHEIDILRPQPWRMRTEVHENGRPIGSNDFQ